MPAGLPEEMRSLFDHYLGCYCDRWVEGHKQQRNTIFSRELAFAVLGLCGMYRATRSAVYLDRLRELCDALLDFERPYTDIAGNPASGFAFRTDSEPTAPVDCHSDIR